MSTSVPDSNELQQLAASYNEGNEQWHQRLVSTVHRLVAASLAQRIPAKLRPLFSVEDLAQETSLRLMVRFRKQPPTELNATFILVTAKRVLTDMLRQHLASKRMPRNGLIDLSPNSSTNLLNEIRGPGQTPSQTEMTHEFWGKAVSLLDARERELVELRFNEDLSYEEIADLFDATPNGIRSKLFRIMQKLRIELSQDPDFESRVR